MNPSIIKMSEKYTHSLIAPLIVVAIRNYLFVYDKINNPQGVKTPRGSNFYFISILNKNKYTDQAVKTIKLHQK
ncbi:hypothetical protein J2T56_000979 [Natronobacillus azotifigens]